MYDSYLSSYNCYLVVDAQAGYVCGVHTTLANQSEMTHFEAAIEGVSIQANRVYADKGSTSSANRQFLKERTIVEQCFGAAKRLFGMRRASYFSTVKVSTQVIMQCIGMYLEKVVDKIFIDPLFRGVVRPDMA